MEDQKEKVQELAETLKSRGLAASMTDAVDKAKNIIYGIASKKEEKTNISTEPKLQEEESTEVTKTNVDESNVVEKDVSNEIKEVEQETSTVESKTNQDQQKLDEVKESHDYDISKEEKTVNEVMGDTKEDVFVSSHESDNLLKENPEIHQTEEEPEIELPPAEDTPETIKTIDESPSEEEPISIDDIPEEKSPEQTSQPVQETSEEKSQLTTEEKKKTDLSEIFDFSKR